MKVNHLIAGEFTIRVSTFVKPGTRGFHVAPEWTLLAELEKLSKEELIAMIRNGSFKSYPSGLTELDNKEDLL